MKSEELRVCQCLKNVDRFLLFPVVLSGIQLPGKRFRCMVSGYGLVVMGLGLWVKSEELRVKS